MILPFLLSSRCHSKVSLPHPRWSPLLLFRTSPLPHSRIPVFITPLHLQPHQALLFYWVTPISLQTFPMFFLVLSGFSSCHSTSPFSMPKVQNCLDMLSRLFSTSARLHPLLFGCSSPAFRFAHSGLSFRPPLSGPSLCTTHRLVWAAFRLLPIYQPISGRFRFWCPGFSCYPFCGWSQLDPEL